MDYIYGILNQHVKKNEYTGGNTDSASVYVDGATNTIFVHTKDSEAKEYAYVSERYAKGTEDGVAVEEGTIGYEDNSKYYKELSAQYSQESKEWAEKAASITSNISFNIDNDGHLVMNIES